MQGGGPVWSKCENCDVIAAHGLCSGVADFSQLSIDLFMIKI